MMSKLIKSLVFLLIIIQQIAVNSFAQKTTTTPEKESETKAKTYEERVSKLRKKEGLLTFYTDPKDGSLYIALKKNQLGESFIYFSHSSNGTEGGHFRGNYRGSKIITFEKYYNKIEVKNINTSYYFDEKNAISKAKDANINHPLLASIKIEHTQGDSLYLINAKDIFLTENLQQIRPSYNEKDVKTFQLGKLDNERSRISATYNYPSNSDVEVQYVYVNEYPKVKGGEAIADARFVNIAIRHSIIAVPKNDFKPRRDDSRVGYFMTAVNDMTSSSSTPYKDVIHRWNLQKKEPNAALSEPVKPITWWIENTTPVEYRETIRKAALRWNMAFEKAGFKNALVVKIQPDDAKWDAGDIRYNVLRWVSSPSPRFGGYGPSFVNPLTGEILGADVILEFVFVTNRLKAGNSFENYGISNFEHQEENHHQHCMLGHYMQESNMFGSVAAGLTDNANREELIKEALYYLVLHELGHTLGLNHNMMASQLHDSKSIHNKKLTEEKGLIASVMDYPAINFNKDRSNQGQYYTTKPGPYDDWAIMYGYSQFSEKEEDKLRAILRESNKPELLFGNDADDMRSPGKAIDPRAMIGDLSSDAISYAIDRLELAQTLLQELSKKDSISKDSYNDLRDKYLVITTEIGKQADVISRYIGGVYINRAKKNQKSTLVPYTPVSLADQKRAIKALNDYVFSAKSLKIEADLASKLQPQRRGFGFFSETEDPKINDRILNIQSNVLNHLLHPRVLRRITDSEIYGNQYSCINLLDDLTAGIFKENGNSYNRNLQIEYTNQLLEILNKENNYDFEAQAAALSQIKKIEKKAATSSTNPKTQATNLYLQHIIDKGLDKK
jgi:hypothetical protein